MMCLVLLLSSFVQQGACMSDVQSRAYALYPNLTVRLRLALAAKRVIDILGAFLMALLLAPVMLGAALAIAMADGMNPLFVQHREGLHGKPFRIFKLRTMDGAGRMTRLGGFLRRMSIDELPQVFNIMLGEMSLVGPRPHVCAMLVEGAAYADLVPGYRERLGMRPGLTGLAQVSGMRGPIMDCEHAMRRFECDITYIREFSLLLDMQILRRTARRSVLIAQNY
jgi:lipopolysaccharide/colanic/teichoic acid biosynthesis glycosyltransferase